MATYLNVSVDAARLAGAVVMDGTVDSGSTSTIVDTELNFPNTDELTGLQVVITSGSAIGDVRIINTFDASTDTITVIPNFSAATAAGVTYVIVDPSIAEFTFVKRCVADAVRVIRRRRLLMHSDESLAGEADNVYTIPSDFVGISEVWYDDGDEANYYPFRVHPHDWWVGVDGLLRIRKGNVPVGRDILLHGVKLMTIPSANADTIPDPVEVFVKLYANQMIRIGQVGTSLDPVSANQLIAQILIAANSLLSEFAQPPPPNCKFFEDF